MTPQQKKLHSQQHEQLEKEDAKHIVLQIKHGNSTTMEKSPDGNSKVVDKKSPSDKSVGDNGNKKNSFVQSKLSGLVPYKDDSDSEQENNSNKVKETFKSSINSSVKAVDSDSYQASIRSIPLPSSSGDAKCVNVKTENARKGSNFPNKQVTQHTATSNPHPNNVDNSIRLKPENNKSAHSLPLTKVNSQGDASLSLEKSDSKNKAVALEFPSVLNVSSPSNLTPNGTTTKQIKAFPSGKWLVHPQDSAPSPRGSCSSSNSVNSTTEWTVESKGRIIIDFSHLVYFN